MKRNAVISLFIVCTSIICGVAVYTEFLRKPSTPISVLMASQAENDASTAMKTDNISKENPTVVTTTSFICRNLNEATESDLQSVDGIGAALSSAIVSQRNALGGFINRKQLLEISGIGQVLADAIMEEFYIPNEQAIDTESPIVHTTSTVTTTLPIHEIIHRFDINLVTREELLTIPDMTENQADALLSFRSELGGFQSVREVSFLKEFTDKYVADTLFQYLYVSNAND